MNPTALIKINNANDKENENVEELINIELLIGSDRLNLVKRCKSSKAIKYIIIYTYKSQHRGRYNSLSTNFLCATDFDSVFEYGLSTVRAKEMNAEVNREQNSTNKAESQPCKTSGFFMALTIK